jgi:hypothetical protein
MADLPWRVMDGTLEGARGVCCKIDDCVKIARRKPAPPLTELQSKLNKRGLMSIVFDGQYKFARYYAPANFKTPTTLEQTMRDNDVQLFDLLSDPLETHNLGLGPENALLNELMPMRWAGTTGVFCRRRSAQSLSEPSGHVLCRHEILDLPRRVC